MIKHRYSITVRLDMNNTLWMISAVFMALFSLSIGSFLNVVIYRLSVRYQLIQSERPSTFLKKRSFCPQCYQTIAWYHNIPLLSFLWLKGRCHSCHQAIAKQYPMIEFLCLCMGLLCFWRFGLDFKAIAALLIGSWLLVLTMFDYRYLLLPNVLTLSLLAFGLIINVNHLFTSLQESLIGVLAGYTGLALIDSVYFLWRKQHGIGQGDWKLLAAIGACLGWQSMLLTLFLASLLGTVTGLVLLITKRATLQSPLPFGVFLSLAAYILLLYDGVYFF